MRTDCLRIFLPIICLILFYGCASDDTTVQDARNQLRNQNIPFKTSAFIEASGKGEEKIVDLFITGKMDVNSASGTTALINAVQNNKPEMVQLLLDNDADVDQANYLGSPLGVAAKNGNLEIAQILIDNDADLDFESDLGTPLVFAAENGHEEVVGLLLENDADIDITTEYIERTPLILAAKNGHTAVVQTLLEHEADIDEIDVKGLNALMYAVSYKHAPIVKLLLENEADPNGDDDKPHLPILRAIGLNEPEILKLLISHGAEIDFHYGKITLLSWAIKNGHYKEAEILLNGGANPDAANDDGSTALDYAILAKNKTLIDLIKKGAANTNIAP